MNMKQHQAANHTDDGRHVDDGFMLQGMRQTHGRCSTFCFWKIPNLSNLA